MNKVDIAAVGGGLTGMSLAAALGSTGVRVALVEAQPSATLTESGYDGRVTAIARGSMQFLRAIGVWEYLAEMASPILAIAVGETGSPVRVHYDANAVDDQPLGYIVENHVIRRALERRIGELGTVRVLSPARLEAVEPLSSGIRLAGTGMDGMEAALLAVCEGRQSPTRDLLGISARRWSYGQTAFVATFAHELPHHGCAVERFFPDGPFAMLPMAGQHSSMVWALDDKLAATIAKLDDDDFGAEVQSRFGGELGGLTLASRRWHYPLSLVWAHNYVSKRAVLVGDAAKGIHPIAGQGWNLAIRDVAAVTEIVVDRLRLGLDPGAVDALERYAAWRRFDGLALVAVTDGINRLFANDVLPVKALRNLGLGLVEHLPPAKQFFMRHAMGLVGDLPRTMRGEAL